MATLREMTVKMGIQIDTAQVDKFRRSVRDVNVALAAVKTSPFVKATQKIVKGIKRIKKQLPAGGLKKRLGAWMKGAATKVKEKSGRFLTNLGDFIKSINVKAVLMRTAAAGFAAAAASIILASSKEDAESSVFGKTGQNGLDRLKKKYKELGELSGGIFDEGALAKGAAGFLEVHNNMDHLMDLFPYLVKIAKASGQSLGTVMTDFAGAIKSGSEESLAKYSGYATWNEQEIEGLSYNGKSMSSMLIPARVRTLKNRLASKSGSINELAASREDDTSYKQRQLKGEMMGGATNLGEKFQPLYNGILDGLLYTVRSARGKTGFNMGDAIEGAMGMGGGTNNTYHIHVKTQKEAEQADKISRAIESTKTENKAKAPYRNGLNHGITG